MTNLWKESFCEAKGRILVAAKFIKAGEVVLEDESLIAAPDGIPVCLNCLEEIKQPEKTCPGCQWPVCSDECSENISSEHKAECEIISSANVTPKSCGSIKLWFSIIPILRILILKRDQEELYRQTIAKFESHWEIRKLQPEVANIIKYIGAFIRKRLNQSWVTDHDVQHAFGVFKTNGVGHVSGSTRVCFLFPNLTLMSHSCISNTDIETSPSRNVKFIAKTDIQEGDELTWSYTNILSPDSTRKSHLLQSWLFECQCQRCCDPTELGLHYSYLKCKCGGFFHPDAVGLQLQCDLCKEVNEGGEVYTQNMIIMINAANTEERFLEILNQLYSEQQIHETHFIRIRLLMRIMDLAIKSGNKKILEAAFDSVGTVLDVVKKLEGGSGKLTKKYDAMKSVITYMKDNENKVQAQT